MTRAITSSPDLATANKLGEPCFNLSTPGNPAGTVQKFGTKTDVAALLVCCKRSVDGYLAKGMPHLKCGARKVLFDLDEVREWAKREFSIRRNGPENGGQAQ